MPPINYAKLPLAGKQKQAAKSGSSSRSCRIEKPRKSLEFAASDEKPRQKPSWFEENNRGGLPVVTD